MSSRTRSTVRYSRSQPNAAGSRVHTPTLALPPLSPDRAAAIRPSGARTAGPSGTAYSTYVGSKPTYVELVSMGGMTWRVPSGSTTVCSTSVAGISAGQYTPYALSGVGGVVVWNPA